MFAQLAAGFATDDINRLAAGDLIEPRAEDGIGREPLRVLGEFDESGLGDFLGQVWGTDLAERRGMDEIEMAPDDLREGVLGVRLHRITAGRVLLDVTREQFQVGVAHVHKDNVTSGGNRPKEFLDPQ